MLILIYSGVVAIVCTLVEALSPWGIDNLTVPAAAAVMLNMLYS
jgi:dolichol kinase